MPSDLLPKSAQATDREETAGDAESGEECDAPRFGDGASSNSDGAVVQGVDLDVVSVLTLDRKSVV